MNRSLLVVFISFTFFLSQNIYATWNKIYSKNNITVFAKKTDQNIIPFKAESLIKQNIAKVLEALKNFDEKPLWSPKLKSVKIHKIISNSEMIFSEFYKTPWPAFDREFLLKGKVIKVHKGLYLLKAKSIDLPDFQNDKYVQANVKTLKIELEEKSTNLTKITFEFNGDFNGLIPNWIMNLIQKKWPYKFIYNLKEHLKKE